jgi:hypothetical protein
VPNSDRHVNRCDVVAGRLKLSPLLELRVAAQTLEGRCLLHIREYVLGNENEFVPTSKGVALPIERLPEMLEAIRELREAGDNDGPCAMISISRGREIRFSVANWKGTTKADIRLYFTDANDEPHPTRKGVRFNLSLLAELERALEALDRHVSA